VNKLTPRNRIKDRMSFMLSIFLMVFMTGLPPSSAHSAEEGDTRDEATQFIRNAAHATDQAWEEFHAAAIEGTLASPLIQVTIEGQLHEVRRLLMEARKAERSQHYQSVKEITEQIQEITQNIIQASRERKQ
jgi:hypothetical protein